MKGPLIAVTDSVFPSLNQARAALAPLDPEIRIAESTSEADILEVARDAEGILVTYAKLPGALLQKLQRCKVIGRFGLGVDNIDIATAAALKITVTYVPDYCLQEVSDHAMALLLALARKVTMSNELVQGGRWEMPAVVPIRRLEGQVLGLIGLGNIPRRVVPKARAFGFKVVAHDPYLPVVTARDLEVELMTFEQVLEMSDYISVHAPLTAETRGLFNAAAFERMKKGAFIINTARGPLIDEAALIQALDRGHLGGAALDVLATEPPSKDSPLLNRSNVILTPHTGFYSVESLEELQTKCANDVARVLGGSQPIYPVRI